MKKSKKFDLIESGKLEQDLCTTGLSSIIMLMAIPFYHNVIKKVAILIGKHGMPNTNINTVEDTFEKTFSEKSFTSMKGKSLRNIAIAILELAYSFDWIEQNTYRETEEDN